MHSAKLGNHLKDFFGVIKTILRFAVVLAYDNFRWYDEETNTNIQFRMFFFGPVIVLGFVGSPREFSGFDFCPHSIIPVT